MIIKNRLLVVVIVLLFVLACMLLQGSLTTSTVSDAIQNTNQSKSPTPQTQEENTNNIYIEC